jgi:membrane-bound ClpP family serine protease
MQEYAGKFADFLEQIALKIRSLTVDRVSRLIRMTGLGILASSLVLSAVIFLVWTLFEVLEIPLTTAGAFGVLGALLFVAGGVMWAKRSRQR